MTHNVLGLCVRAGSDPTAAAAQKLQFITKIQLQHKASSLHFNMLSNVFRRTGRRTSVSDRYRYHLKGDYPNFL